MYKASSSAQIPDLRGSSACVATGQNRGSIQNRFRQQKQGGCHGSGGGHRY
eukprot:gene26901-4514_t